MQPRWRPRKGLRRHLDVTLAAGLVLSGSAAAAQTCPPRSYAPAAVALQVNIEACDYLAELAEPAALDQDCARMARTLTGNSASKTSRLTALLADTLRLVFGRHFGFLDWEAAAAPRWKAEVRLFQGGLGGPLLFQVALRDNAAVRRASEALRFENYSFDAVGLMRTQSVAVIRDRWAARVDSLLTANEGVNRAKLVQTVFRAIPLADLDVRELADQGRMWASVPVRDRDLRVDPFQPAKRPVFEWRVDSVIQGPVIQTQDMGLFRLGRCQPLAGGGSYKCEMLYLQYGPRNLSGDSLLEFFKSARLQPPKTLFVFDYTPAEDPCGTRGMPPQ